MTDKLPEKLHKKYDIKCEDIFEDWDELINKIEKITINNMERRYKSYMTWATILFAFAFGILGISIYNFIAQNYILAVICMGCFGWDFAMGIVNLINMTYEIKNIYEY